MKTKKAFIAKNRVYPSKDAAILCTGSKDVTVVNIREDYELDEFEACLSYDDGTLIIDPFGCFDLITWHETIEFEKVGDEFQQVFKEGQFNITDLSQELQNEISELVKESICSTCNGERYIEVMNCKNWSNECCGGCYTDEPCPDCNIYE